MFRFTTPYHRFKVPFDPAQLAEVFITYWKDEIVLEKSLTDISVDGQYLVVHLTQEDTALFGCDCHQRVTAYVQLRGKFLNGEAWASKRLSVTVDGVYKDGVI